MNIEFDLNGDDSLQADFEQLQNLGESDRVDVVGTDVEYAVFLEFGTENMPPYPFFRPAIQEFQADPEGFILGSDAVGFGSIDEIPNTDRLIASISAALVEQMEDNASADDATDRSPGTDDDHPQRDIGNLVADISATRVR